MISRKRIRERFSVPGDQLIVLPTKSFFPKGMAEKEPSVEEVRLKNIVDMGVGFSGMIRLFERGSKLKIYDEILRQIKSIESITSKEEFNKKHHAFCEWGVNEIKVAKKELRNKKIKPSRLASYGQIAKTFDVALKASIYYAHLPDCRTAEKISLWLNAAVDNKMMAMLREYRPCYYKKWPEAIEEVKNKDIYDNLQQLVREYIKEKHHDKITPVQFDDIYWRKLNRKE